MSLDPTNERIFSLELIIAKFLRYGVLVAGALMLLGWLMQIDFHHDPFSSFTQYHHLPLTQAVSAAFAQHAYGLLIGYLGLCVLISLPIVRVALTAGVFVIDHDYGLAACAGLVLGGLALSFALGYAI